MISALRAQQADSSSLGGALGQMTEPAHSPWLLTAVAIGLIAYGRVAAAMSRSVHA